MQTIKYTFADGTTSEIEVTDEIYSLHLAIVQQERRLYWRESRRQISLENLTEQGIDFADTAANPLADYIQKENTEQVRKAIAALLPEQQAPCKTDILRGKNHNGNSKGGKGRKVGYRKQADKNLCKTKKFFRLDRELCPFFFL